MGKPKIRFRGFNDDWEQRKLGEIVDIYDGVHQTPDYQDSGIMFLSVENISTLRSNKYISLEAFERDYKVYPEKGDILMTRIGDIGTTNVVENTEKVAFYVSLALLKAKTTNPYFLSNAMKNEVFQKELRQRSLLTAIPQKINKDEIGKTDISITVNPEEQEKIGEYFKNIDYLITLHQRKCEETKKIKKYMLQNMFPQEGEKTPRIRFEGFTDDWEQRKLGDVFEQTSNLVNPKEDEIELWSLTVEDGLTKKSDRYNREFLVKKDDIFKEVRPGDIVYNPMNMTLGAVGYNGMEKSVAVSGYYTTMVTKDNYDSYYINTWLKSPQAILLYRTYATGSLIEKQRVQFSTLSIIPVAFPRYEEQAKIGRYFQSLDHLITLHQRKRDELQNLKKFMLQNMFV